MFDKVFELIDKRKPRAVAIDGNSGGGKSTLSGKIASRYDCNIIHMDDFFLPPERKTPGRLSEPGGNVDYERFKAEIKPGDSFIYNKYDCKTGELSPVTVSPKPLTIIEGVYSLHPLLRDMFDLKIFLCVSPGVQERRILERNGEYMLSRFKNEWIPLENLYFDTLNIRNLCDLIVNTDNLAAPGVPD